MGNRICIDIGGTFTDAAVLNDKGEISVHKSLTTPDDFSEGIVDVLKVAAEENNMTLDELLKSCDYLIGGSLTHGSTITTNALIEGKVAKVGLLCTRGFRDVLLFREGYKENPFDFQVDYPEPFIPRYLTLPVTERINSEGKVEIPLNEKDVLDAIRQFKEWDVKAIAVSLIWSVANDEHEQRIKDLVQKEWPGITVVLGSEVNPCIREYRRTVAACMDASLKPMVTGYIKHLIGKLRSVGFKGELGMLSSSGGVLSTEELEARPIYSIDCGPALAPIAGRAMGTGELGINNVVTVDMGGTSFDVSVVTDGIVAVSREAKIGEELPGISKVDSRSIGAGGGSIAWVDKGGLIRVGPHSAGSVPGPACYNRGGETPTVTDANVVMGYIDPDYFLGGRMKIDKTLAEKAVSKIAKQLNVGLMDAAYAIYATVNANMYAAMKNITIWQGIDPRGHVCVAGGGAAGVHVCPIADMLEIQQILVPKVAGALSASGGTIANMVAEYSTSFYTESRDFDYSGLSRILMDLKNKAQGFLDRHGIKEGRGRIELTVEARYPYQVWELPVKIHDLDLSQEKGVKAMVERFHQEHERVFAVREPDAYIECIFWRAEAIGQPTTIVKFAEEEKVGKDPVSEAIMGTREAYFKSLGGTIETAVYRGSELRYGNQFVGPAIIEEATTTVVIPPKKRVNVEKYGSYLIRNE
jgi:N-methylhydantoinase A